MAPTLPTYFLPQEEIERLGRRRHCVTDTLVFAPLTFQADLQHDLMLLTLEGELALCPKVETANRVLDIGTGTGAWAMEYGMLPMRCFDRGETDRFYSRFTSRGRGPTMFFHPSSLHLLNNYPLGHRCGPESYPTNIVSLPQCGCSF